VPIVLAISSKKEPSRAAGTAIPSACCTVRFWDMANAVPRKLPSERRLL
jgi:hypothetical protein